MVKGPITSPLSQSAKEATGPVLQGSLVDLIDLGLSGKQAHWNVVGSHFIPVHRQLDELVDTARSFADDVAERAAAIGVAPSGQAKTVAETSGLPEFPGGWKQDREVVATIVPILQTLVERMRARIDDVEKADLVTQDLLLGIARKLEEMHWMWQAQLANSA
jgi:starvation-inducible DNA-binding protein